MKRITKLFPIFTVAAGLACAYFRSQLYQALDAKKLIPAGHPAYLPLTVLSVLCALLLALQYLWSKRETFRFHTPFPIPAVGCIAAAVGHLVLYFTQKANTGMFASFALIAAVCFLLLAYYRFTAKKPPLWILAVINISFLLLCFGQYRHWGTFTQLQGYLFPALSALLLNLYSLQQLLSGMPEGSGKKALLFNQAALFCCLVCISSDSWFYYLMLSLWLASDLFAQIRPMHLPREVRHCIHALENAGFRAYAVGGCVRDALLGLTPHDYDLCTNARPEDICRIFAKYQLVRNGEKHGTIGVVMNHQVYEITTFRTEGSYQDNRHPDWVEFVDRIEDDLARRDFTVNAMAYHPKDGYIDPFGGKQDLWDGVLRAVGDPKVRFQEDGLRILRGVRFACRFGLEPEKDTFTAMEELAPLLDNLARERVCSELTQILCQINAKQLQQYCRVLLQVIPELGESIGFCQHNPHHKHDVFTHTAKVLELTDSEPALRWAALLHDIGKPKVFTRDEKGVGHFHGHAQVSAEMAEDILRRLKASNALREQVVFLIARHMDILEPDAKLLRKKLSKYGPESLTQLALLQHADRLGTGTCKDQDHEKLMALIRQLTEEEGQLQLRDLAIDGNDLMALGFEPGPQLGQCQKLLLEQVLDGTLPNEKQALLEQAKAYLK